MSQAFAQYPEGCRVRIEGIGSLSQARPDPAGQKRAQDLVGQERLVVEADRYGYAWMSWEENGTSADFCLRPNDLSMVAPAPPKVAENAAPRNELWQELKQKPVEFGPSTAAVLAAFAVFLVTGVVHHLLDGSDAPPDDSIWFFLPASALLMATIAVAIYAVRNRRTQYVLELAACAGLWIVLFVAR